MKIQSVIVIPTFTVGRFVGYFVGISDGYVVGDFVGSISSKKECPQNNEKGL